MEGNVKMFAYIGTYGPGVGHAHGTPGAGIHAFECQADGSLLPRSVAAMTNPSYLALCANDTHIVAAQEQTDGVASLHLIDQSTGELTAVGEQSTGGADAW